MGAILKLYRTSSTSPKESVVFLYYGYRGQISPVLSFKDISGHVFATLDQEVSRHGREGDNPPVVHPGTAC